jgi:hypothetical protein
MPKKKHKPIPPCPDSERYTLVELEDKFIWRLKRGLRKEAKVNSALQIRADAIKTASPAAKRVSAALLPYTEDLERGNLQSRISGRLVTGMLQYGYPALRALNGVECQRAKIDELKSFLLAGYRLVKDEEQGTLTLHILSANGKIVARRSKLVDSWKITMLTMSGSTEIDGDLDVVETSSGVTSTKEKIYELVLVLRIPAEEDYLVALRVECFEFGEAGGESTVKRNGGDWVKG